MAYPLILRPVARAEYFEQRQPFSLIAFVKTPYGLMIGEPLQGLRKPRARAGSGDTHGTPASCPFTRAAAAAPSCCPPPRSTQPL